MASKNIIELTQDNFDSSTSSGVVLVDFWAPWCGPCQMQAPVLERVADQVGDRATVAKLNVDEAPAIASRFQITGIPTLMIFKDGQPVANLVGLQPEKALLAALEDAA